MPTGGAPGKDGTGRPDSAADAPVPPGDTPTPPGDASGPAENASGPLLPPTYACRTLRVEGGGFGVYSSLAWDGDGEEGWEPWCQGVGPALAYYPGDFGVAESAPGFSLDTVPHVTLVSWNVHAGGGDVDALIRDLRSGRLDGTASPSFVLLLQEVFRTGPDVPDDPGDGARGGRRVAPGPAPRSHRSVDAIARRNGLHLLYVPSMRNGGTEHLPEDKGNAILATFPLEDLLALELPMEAQRRVAVAARVSVPWGVGGCVPLRVVSLHLDLRSPWGQLHRSLGAGRAEQARFLTGRLAQESAVALGGDLNTWFGGPREEAIRIFREAFPMPETRRDVFTLDAPGPLPNLVLDHLFFRLPEGMTASYQVVRDRYGSDHYPVVSRIAYGEAPVGPQGLPGPDTSEIR